MTQDDCDFCVTHPGLKHKYPLCLKIYIVGGVVKALQTIFGESDDCAFLTVFRDKGPCEVIVRWCLVFLVSENGSKGFWKSA